MPQPASPARHVLRPALAAVALLGALAGTAGAQSVSVRSADPAEGEQGTIGLQVRVTGRGFAPGAQVAFLRSGTSDTGGVQVQAVAVISSTDLDVVVDITDEAALDLYDIRVVNTNGRSGKGTDLFRVTQKGAKAACGPFAMPAGVQLVGALNPGTDGTTYAAELGLGMTARPVDLAAGQAILTAVGRTGGIEVFFLDPNAASDSDLVDVIHPHVTVPIAGSTWIRELALGDVDGDGIVDLLASDRAGAWVVRGQPSPAGLGFLPPVALPLPNTVQVSNFFGTRVVLADLDDDGGDEIVIAQPGIKSGNKSHNGKIHLYGWSGGSPQFLRTVVPVVNPGLTLADGYGHAVSVGPFEGSAAALVAGARGRTENGAVWILPDPLSAPAPGGVASIAPTVLTGPPGGLPIGSTVTAADVDGDGLADIAATSAWGASVARGEVFRGGTSVEDSAFRITPSPGLDTGWATSGISVGRLLGGAAPDVVVGAPNASSESSCSNVGALYVFPGRATPGPDWTPIVLRPHLPYDGYGAYGWSAAFVDGTNLLLVAEKGRAVNGVAAAGQVYVYRVAAP